MLWITLQGVNPGRRQDEIPGLSGLLCSKLGAVEILSGHAALLEGAVFYPLLSGGYFLSMLQFS